MRLWSLHPRYLDPQGLVALWREALLARGYSFDASKVGSGRTASRIAVTSGQMQYEWKHLLKKLSKRSPQHYKRNKAVHTPDCHPLLRCRAGKLEAWERP